MNFNPKTFDDPCTFTLREMLKENLREDLSLRRDVRNMSPSPADLHVTIPMRFHLQGEEATQTLKNMLDEIEDQEYLARQKEKKHADT